MLGYANRLQGFGPVSGTYGVAGQDTADAPANQPKPKTLREIINAQLHPEYEMSDEQRLRKDFHKFAERVDTVVDALVTVVDMQEERAERLIARIQILETALGAKAEPAKPETPTAPAAPTV